MSLPAKVTVYEVGPRDGLQNEPAFIPSGDKLRLIRALAKAGLPRIEITSFVHPRWIPPLADADQVARGLPELKTSRRYTALVPNLRGFKRAQAAGMREIAVFMSASESHNKRNINKTRAETYTAFEPVFAACAEANIAVRAYVSVVWGCPYEGDVDPEQVLAVCSKLKEMGAYQISLGDTTGVGNPRQTEQILDVLLDALPADFLAMHMHDTRGSALANCLIGLQRGITTFDSSIAGLGGCPYAPGASGNLATEDLVYMLHEMGIETGIDLELLVDAGLLAQSLLGRTLPSKALQAMAATRHIKGKS